MNQPIANVYPASARLRVVSHHASGSAFAKDRATTVRLEMGVGAVGDRHAGRDPERALLITSATTYTDLQKNGLDLGYGDLGENMVFSGLRVNALPRGARLCYGEVVLELTGACPVCARLCELSPHLPKWLHGRRGVYARVLRGGAVREGDLFTVSSGVSEPT